MTIPALSPFVQRLIDTRVWRRRREIRAGIYFASSLVVVSRSLARLSLGSYIIQPLSSFTGLVNSNLMCSPPRVSLIHVVLTIRAAEEKKRSEAHGGKEAILGSRLEWFYPTAVRNFSLSRGSLSVALSPPPN
jgi:hypothetical protein